MQDTASPRHAPSARFSAPARSLVPSMRGSPISIASSATHLRGPVTPPARGGFDGVPTPVGRSMSRHSPSMGARQAYQHEGSPVKLGHRPGEYEVRRLLGELCDVDDFDETKCRGVVELFLEHTRKATRERGVSERQIATFEHEIGELCAIKACGLPDKQAAAEQQEMKLQTQLDTLLKECREHEAARTAYSNNAAQAAQESRASTDQIQELHHEWSRETFDGLHPTTMDSASMRNVEDYLRLKWERAREIASAMEASERHAARAESERLEAEKNAEQEAEELAVAQEASTQVQEQLRALQARLSTMNDLSERVDALRQSADALATTLRGEMAGRATLLGHLM